MLVYLFEALTGFLWFCEFEICFWLWCFCYWFGLVAGFVTGFESWWWLMVFGVLVLLTVWDLCQVWWVLATAFEIWMLGVEYWFISMRLMLVFEVWQVFEGFESFRLLVLEVFCIWWRLNRFFWVWELCVWELLQDLRFWWCFWFLSFRLVFCWLYVQVEICVRFDEFWLLPLRFGCLELNIGLSVWDFYVFFWGFVIFLW